MSKNLPEKSDQGSPGKRIVKNYEDLVAPRLDEIIEWRESGKTIKYICSKLGIGKTAFYEWQKAHPEITDAIREGDKKFRENTVPTAQSSLMKKLKDRTVTDVITEEIKEDGVITKTKTTTKKRVVLADTTAIIFALRNGAPMLWNELETRLTNGRIDKLQADIESSKEGVDLQEEILQRLSHYGQNTEDVQVDTYTEPEPEPDDSDDSEDSENDENEPTEDAD